MDCALKLYQVDMKCIFISLPSLGQDQVKVQRLAQDQGRALIAAAVDLQAALVGQDHAAGQGDDGTAAHPAQSQGHIPDPGHALGQRELLLHTGMS